jgi:hypothetical protein
VKHLGILALSVALFTVRPGSAQVRGVFDFDHGTEQGWHIAGLYQGGGLVEIPGAFSDKLAPWMDDVDAPAAPPKVDPTGDGAGAIVLGTPSAVLYPVGQETVWAWHFNSPDLDRFPEWQTATAARIQVVNLMRTEVSTSQNWIELVVVLEDTTGKLRYFSDFTFHPIPPNVLPASLTWSTFTLDIAALGLPPGILRTLQLRVFGEHDLYRGFVAVDDVTPSFCGDGVVDTGEQCDAGDQNGASASCCSAGCTFRASEFTCRPALDPCDVVERCTGADGDCPGDLKAPNDTSCDDADVCNGAETCQDGLCTPGSALDCDDGKACTTDSCDAMTGCANEPLEGCVPCGDGGFCDDGNPCTDDACVAGACRFVDDDTNTCADGDLCNGTETCRAGRCTPGTALDCRDGNVCTTDSCDPREGCRHGPAPDGAPCDDGDACTRTDACRSAVCTGADPVVCTAPDACADAGSCDPGTGTCSAPAPRPDGTSCDDGNPATSTDLCQVGRCEGVSLSAVAPETVVVPPHDSAQQVPVVVTLDETTGPDPASVEAQGFVDVPAVAGVRPAVAVPERSPGHCPMVSPSPADPNVVPATRKVRKVFHGRRRRVTLRLKLNGLGRCLLKTQGTLTVEVRLTLTDRAGRSVLQRLLSQVRRGR